MLLRKNRQAITATCTALLAATLLVAGCGRSPADPTANSDKVSPPASDDPGSPAGPGAPDVPAPPAPGTGGGTVTPGGSGGGTGGPLPAPAPGKPSSSSGLRPLPKVTPIPAFKTPAAGGGDASGARDDFSALLGDYGYLTPDNTPHNLQMQLMPILRTPIDHAERLKWGTNANMQAKWDFHVHQNRALESFPADMTYEQWLAQGQELAARQQNFSIYVARTALYRSILADRYNDVRDERIMIFYKRLNRTPYAVSYRADGTIDDFCAYQKITIPGNRELFLAVPTAYYQ